MATLAQSRFAPALLGMLATAPVQAQTAASAVLSDSKVLAVENIMVDQSTNMDAYLATDSLSDKDFVSRSHMAGDAAAALEYRAALKKFGLREITILSQGSDKTDVLSVAKFEAEAQDLQAATNKVAAKIDLSFASGTVTQPNSTVVGEVLNMIKIEAPDFRAAPDNDPQNYWTLAKGIKTKQDAVHVTENAFADFAASVTNPNTSVEEQTVIAHTLRKDPTFNHYFQVHAAMIAGKGRDQLPDLIESAVRFGTNNVPHITKPIEADFNALGTNQRSANQYIIKTYPQLHAVVLAPASLAATMGARPTQTPAVAPK